MDIGMATKDDSDGSREEGDQRNVDTVLQAVCTGRVKGNWGARGGSSRNAQRCTGGKDANRGEKSSWQKSNGKDGGKAHERGGKGGSTTRWRENEINKMHQTMMKSCNCGVCWKKAKLSNGKR